jgi:hypothetical protein
LLQRFRLLLLAVAASLALAAPAAEAQVLYGADGAGGNPAANLYILDPATGSVVSTIGPIGFPVTGLAFHPITGVLYGTTGAEIGTPSLITINPSTGAGTLVGANTCGPIADITFRSDGTLFGWSECDDDLVTINLANGVETVVADSGFGTAGSGIAFSPGGTLFFTGNNSNGLLRTINPATGQEVDAVQMTGGPAPNRVNALAFNGAGTLYGSVKGTPGSLVTINTATGVVTTVGPTVADLDAIVFAPAVVVRQAPNVPTLSQWAVIALALLVVASVLWARRRT